MLSGSLYAINDISGLPQFEVFSDGTIGMGKYGGSVIVSSSIDLSGSLYANQIGVHQSSPISLLHVGDNISLNPSVTNISTGLVVEAENSLGNSAGDYVYPFEIIAMDSTNRDRLQIAPYRLVTNTS